MGGREETEAGGTPHRLFESCGGRAMAAPRKKLKVEVTCSVCKELFADPVLTACGHNFCRLCISQCWGDSPSEATCPQCRESIPQTGLKPNRQLANVAAIIEELSVQPKEQEAGRWRVCERHQEPRKLFCKEDEAPICVVCDRSKQHREHNVLPVQEAAQEYQGWLHSSLENVRKKREKILEYKVKSQTASEKLLKQTKAEKLKVVAEFNQLHLFLETQQKCLVAQLEEVEKEIERKRAADMNKLSEELSSLEKTIQEMEQQCQLPAGEQLQDVKRALQSSEKEPFGNLGAYPPAQKWRVWDCCDIFPFLEGSVKQFKDNLISGLQLQKANVTLDPDTAHPQLIVSEDCTSIKRGDRRQDLPDNPERFTIFPWVLGWQRFTAGRHCWEVSVGSEEGWAVGVARTSVWRKIGFRFGPEEGIWAVEKRGGHYRAFGFPKANPLSLSGEPNRIRVTVNYEGGRVAFFDADSAAPIHIYSASFSGEKLSPFFSVYYKSHLILSP